MDPKLVKAAKEIPGRLKEVMNSMFEQSQPALRSGVSALRDSLKKLDGYLSEVEKEHFGSRSGGRGKAARGTEAAEPVRRRRKRGRFATSGFILTELARGGNLRPVELAVKLAQATGRDKQNAMQNVNTTLSRLVQAGSVNRRDGLYSATGAASTGTTSGTKAVKKTRMKRGRSTKATAAAV